jgi:hypothetical protein
LKKKLRVLIACLTLEAGVIFGVPMRPDQIRELMHQMNQPTLAHVLKETEAGGDGDGRRRETGGDGHGRRRRWEETEETKGTDLETEQRSERRLTEQF